MHGAALMPPCLERRPILRAAAATQPSQYSLMASRRCARSPWPYCPLWAHHLARPAAARDNDKRTAAWRAVRKCLLTRHACPTDTDQCGREIYRGILAAPPRICAAFLDAKHPARTHHFACTKCVSVNQMFAVCRCAYMASLSSAICQRVSCWEPKEAQCHGMPMRSS